jgi:hypothetical protein
VLIGFGLVLFFGIYRALLKAGLLTSLSQRQSSAVLRLILKYGFSVAISLVVLGFAYAGWQAYQYGNREHGLQNPITQQAGTCGSNIVGDNNQATIDCVDKAAKTK